MALLDHGRCRLGIGHWALQIVRSAGTMLTSATLLQIPWGGSTVALGMAAWVLLFLGVALILLPALGSLVGIKV